MRLYLILLFQCVLITSLSAQRLTTHHGPKRNSFSISSESIISAGDITINYERIWVGAKKIRFSTRVGIGVWYSKEQDALADFYYKCTFNLFWKGRYDPDKKIESGFEIGMGLSIRMMEKEHSDIPYVYYWVREPAYWPILTLGRRTQFEHFQTRVYVSSFGVGLTLGYSF